MKNILITESGIEARRTQSCTTCVGGWTTGMKATVRREPQETCYLEREAWRAERSETQSRATFLQAKVPSPGGCVCSFTSLHPGAKTLTKQTQTYTTVLKQVR